MDSTSCRCLWAGPIVCAAVPHHLPPTPVFWLLQQNMHGTQTGNQQALFFLLNMAEE